MRPPSNRLHALGFVAATGITSVTLAQGFIWAKDLLVVPSFAAALVAWTGYLFAHYFMEGCFMDGGGTAARLTRGQWLEVLAGSSVLIGGMVIGAAGVRAGDLLVTEAGSVLFLGGYMAAHYAATGKVL